MALIFAPGHLEIAEVEFQPAHPDIFCSYLSAAFVRSLADMIDREGKNLEEFRADVNVQASYSSCGIEETIKKFNFNISGQINLPRTVFLDLEDVAKIEIKHLLENAGYEKGMDFDEIHVSRRGTTNQSIHLNGTSRENKFADSCVVYGHYIAPPFGIDGTFASLRLAQLIDREIHNRVNDFRDIRPDGKVHITLRHSERGYEVERVYLSIAHGEEIDKEAIAHHVRKITGVNPSVLVNAGGDFSKYFLAADSGVSKAKDDAIITGGLHGIGTDRVWGKCLYKASSTLISYAFALSRAVCEAIGARYSSVAVYAEYGQRDATLVLQEIDPLHEKQRVEINKALENLLRDRDSIREILEMPVNIETYRLFNQPGKFHDMNMPWKKYNPKLVEAIRSNLGDLVGHSRF